MSPGFIADPDIVYEAEVVDVDGYFGVENGAKCGFDLVAECGLSRGVVCGRGCFWGAHDPTDFF